MAVPLASQARQRTQAIALPAPMKGMDIRDGAYASGTEFALSIINMIPRALGCAVRPGWIEWITNIGLTPELSIQEVRSLIPFHDGNPLNDRLWAFTKAGIYDVTLTANDPPRTITLPVGGAEAGYFSWVNFANNSNAHFLLTCDGINGVWRYAVAGGWIELTAGGGPNQINGVNPRNLAFVTAWKNRLWFVEKDTASGWYLPVNAVAGTVSRFDFGQKFRYGGSLVALYNWTVDGGNGIDDRLVAVSSAGDVVIYEGTDPASAASFRLVGSWYVGPPPTGRRIASEFGGDLFILSEYGLLPLSRIIQGTTVTPASERAVSVPIINLISELMVRTRGMHGWEVKADTEHNLFVIVTPKETATPFRQFSMELTQFSWSVFSALPIFTAETFRGLFYFGTLDGRVCKFQGTVDAVLRDGSGGAAIDWALLTRSSVLGAPGRVKRVQMMRPYFIGDQAAAYVVQPRYDFDFSEIQIPPALPASTTALWDVGIWDLSVWGGTYTTTLPTTGTLGMGFRVCYAMRGQSTANMNFIGVDALYDVGGFL